MKLFVIFTVIAVLAEVFAYEGTSVLNLKPRWYYMLQLNDLSKISIQAHDISNNLVTIYLNSGAVDYFDSRNSLINCNDVVQCSVNEMGLVPGTYTLFVFNDYYMFDQNVSLFVSTHSQSDDLLFYFVCGLLISIFVIFFLFVSCTAKKFWKVQYPNPQVEMIPNSQVVLTGVV